MAHQRLTEALTVAALATLVIMTIAAPVLRAPSQRLFGMETVGRHGDPFTVMEQFGGRVLNVGVYWQPITDVPGALLARLTGAVAAYNWLVLLSFPLAAAAAYLLARHLTLSPAGASVAALAYAFSPFHLAHAAYHLQVAQTEWIPLYLLALWRCLDEASPAAVGWLAAATLAVTLSDFYGGYIAAVITPVAIAAYWLAPRRSRPRSMRQLAITTGTLAVIAMLGTIYVWYGAHALAVNRAAFAFNRDDLYRYSAKWWSYLVPPVADPLLGRTARRLWTAVGVRDGLLEQQVSLGWGIVALGLIAVLGWLVPGDDDRQSVSRARVPVLAAVAAAALLCSLSPERTIGRFTFIRPSALLYSIAPMFRSYARFGVVVQLMAALLAGIGVDRLRRAGTTGARVLCVALVALAVGEYAVSPSAMWRDVLPTAAHRWVVDRPGRPRALDCTPLGPDSESVQWLTHHRIALSGGAITDCLEPDLPRSLAANGYAYLIVRRDSVDGQWFAARALPDGLRLAARFDDAVVFAVSASAPAVYTTALTGFFPREHNVDWTWRWMGGDAAWTIVNTTARPIVAALDLELSAFRRTRRMDIRLDGQMLQTLMVDPPRRAYRIGPITLFPGSHALAFHPAEAPTVADDVLRNGDGRGLSFAIGTWKWIVRREQP